ncbi:MAG: hypothetical protein ABI769_20005 [Pseudomonadota bacterium]
MAVMLPGPAFSTPPPPSKAALDLVAATRFDEFVAEAAAVGGRNLFTQGKLTRQQFNCVILRPEDWTQDVARFFSGALTEEELAIAAAYFHTKSGQSLMSEIARERDARRRGDTSFKRKPLGESPDADAQAFAETTAAKKFLSQGLGNNAGLEQLTRIRIEAELRKCAGAEPSGS